jgi:hypothetical protein
MSHFLNREAELRRLVSLLIIHSHDAERIPAVPQFKKISLMFRPASVRGFER